MIVNNQHSQSAESQEVFPGAGPRLDSICDAVGCAAAYCKLRFRTDPQTI